MEDFKKSFPARFINVGVAEQAMIGLAAGLAQRGFKPFCYTIATFALFRAYEFIRCDLAYQNLPVTIVGMGAGLAYPTLGGTHQAIEDVAVAMACPNMTVLAPCDPAEVVECACWCAGRESGGPIYLRIGKVGEPNLTAGAAPWEFGKPRWLRKHNDLHRHPLILTYGPIASVALAVADFCKADVLAISTLTDLTMLWDYLHGDVIVIEEAVGAPLGTFIKAEAAGWAPGLSSVRLFALSREFNHTYGSRDELLAYYDLTAEKIIEQVGQP